MRSNKLRVEPPSAVSSYGKVTLEKKQGGSGNPEPRGGRAEGLYDGRHPCALVGREAELSLSTLGDLYFHLVTVGRINYQFWGYNIRIDFEVFTLQNSIFKSPPPGGGGTENE